MLNSVKNHFRFLVLPQMKKTCFGDFRQMKKYLWLYPVRAEQTLPRGGGWEIFFLSKGGSEQILFKYYYCFL